MAYSVLTLPALLKAVRDQLQTELGLDDDHCAIQPDGQPDPYHGEDFVAVHPGGIDLDNPDWEVWSASPSVQVTITRRTAKIPTDRIGPELIEAATGLLALAEKAAKIIHDSQEIRIAATANLESGSQYFVEPLRLLGGIPAPVKRMHDWFSSTPQGNSKAVPGYSVTMRFGNAKRYEGFPLDS